MGQGLVDSMQSAPDQSDAETARLKRYEPNQNAYIERFNRTFRTEVLDAYLFNSIEQVQAIADDWLTQYNEYRPHDALGGVPPKQFMPRLIHTTAADSRNQLSA
ncbi:integrase core domain-containing protein [Ideonella dechloratans]|uniref:integrase core domain-containing protein n=1 Tax=Ideonella dechloratans TaxID=36863 RepID=UPI0035B15A5C